MSRSTDKTRGAADDTNMSADSEKTVSNGYFTQTADTVSSRCDSSFAVNAGTKMRDSSSAEGGDDNTVENKDNDLHGNQHRVDDAVMPLENWTRREGELFIRRFLKSFSKAAAVYSGVRAFTAFMKNPFRKGIPALWRSLLSKDCFRFAAFLGLYPSLYHLIVSILRRYRKQKDGWTYGVAGSVAGLSMALAARSHRKTLTFFVTARALGAGATTLVSRGTVPSVPYAETLTFCANCAVLVTCVALYPALLQTGYYHSVLQWSRDYSEPVITKLFREPGDRFLTCQEVGMHQGPCTRHALEDFVRSMPVFAKLYLPIHLAPVFLFKRNMLKTRPVYVLQSLVKNLSYSTLFLSTMVLIAKYVICLLRNGLGKPPPLPAYIPAVAGFLCGFSVLFERVSRRKELVLFVIPQMLNALLALAEARSRGQGQGRRWKRGAHQGYVVLFALAMGVVMHAYEREPPSLTMLMHGVLRFFVGDRREPEVEEGSGLKGQTSGNAKGAKSRRVRLDSEA